MADSLFEVVCPCCQAALRIDGATESVITHTPRPQPRMVEDLTAAVTRLKGEAARREEAFAKSVEANRKQGDVLNRKFDELLKEARKEPNERPLRDLDLD